MKTYKIIGRQRESTTITKYVLVENETGKIITASKEEVYKAAFNKLIEGVSIQRYNGKIIMKGIGFKISELPSYDEAGNILNKSSGKDGIQKSKVLITGKYCSGKNIIGYRISIIDRGELIKESILPRDKVIQLAKNGLITNVRCQSSNGENILRGINCNLSKLPQVKVEEYA